MSDIDFKKLVQTGLSDIFSFKKKPTSAVGIDIGSSSIKVVQLKKEKGKAILETYGIISLGPYQEQEIGTATNLSTEALTRALVDVLKESNVTTKNGVLSIPASSSLIFNVVLPGNINEEDLGTIVPTEARKYVPVPITEVSLDWSLIPEEIDDFVENNKKEKGSLVVDSKKEVLVVAIHNDILLKYQDLSKKIQISSEIFEMEVFSIVRSSLSHDLAPVLFMDFGASKTKVYIVESGIVRVSHTIGKGSQDISRNISQALSISFDEAEKLKREVTLESNSNKDVESIIKLSLDNIFSSTNSVVLNFEKKYNKNISKVVLVGGGSTIKGLLEYSKNKFNSEVVYADPFSKTEAPAFLNPILKTSGPEFAVAVGLALRQLL